MPVDLLHTVCIGGIAVKLLPWLQCLEDGSTTADQRVIYHKSLKSFCDDEVLNVEICSEGIGWIVQIKTSSTETEINKDSNEKLKPSKTI